MTPEPQAINPFTAADAMALTSALGSRGRRPAPCKRIRDVVFEISQDRDKSYRARCNSENISTKAATWEKLRANIRTAVRAFSLDEYQPGRVQLHFVRDETLVL
jgi:hypothetical protein